ncbi:hypothetical protein MHYP_G00105320 [Metynnis hypsauchen]
MSMALGIDMRKHCSYHPASAGVVECANGTIKGRLAKMTQSTGLTWTKVLPRSCGKPEPDPKNGQGAVHLKLFLAGPQTQVKAVLPEPADIPLHNFKPGQCVLAKDLRWTRWNQPRWRGPFQVLLVMHTAVKVEGRATSVFLVLLLPLLVVSTSVAQTNCDISTNAALNGVYTIYPAGDTPVQVYCDVGCDGQVEFKKWTVCSTVSLS